MSGSELVNPSDGGLALNKPALQLRIPAAPFAAARWALTLWICAAAS